MTWVLPAQGVVLPSLCSRVARVPCACIACVHAPHARGAPRGNSQPPRRRAAPWASDSSRWSGATATSAAASGRPMGWSSVTTTWPRRSVALCCAVLAGVQACVGARGGCRRRRARPTGSRASLPPSPPLLLRRSRQEEISHALTHELVHAYDHCRAASLDWSDCRHHACSEIRAAMLSGARACFPLGCGLATALRRCPPRCCPALEAAHRRASQHASVCSPQPTNQPTACANCAPHQPPDRQATATSRWSCCGATWPCGRSFKSACAAAPSSQVRRGSRRAPGCAGPLFLCVPHAAFARRASNQPPSARAIDSAFPPSTLHPAVAMNPHCKGAKAGRAVDAVFEECFKDTAPFDRIP